MVVSHPSMKSNVTTDKQKPQKNVYVVGDANSDQQEQVMHEVPSSDAEMHEVPKEDVVPVDPIQPPVRENTAKKLFEDLVFTGMVSDTIEIKSHKFVISTLTHREHNDLMRDVYSFGDQSDLFTVRTLTLAHALRSVDGVPLENFDVGKEYDSVYLKKLAILDSMQRAVIEKLYDFYSKLDKESEESVAGVDKEIKK